MRHIVYDWSVSTCPVYNLHRLPDHNYLVSLIWPMIVSFLAFYFIFLFLEIFAINLQFLLERITGVEYIVIQILYVLLNLR